MMDWFNTNLYRDFALRARLPAGVSGAQAAERRSAGRRRSTGAKERSKAWFKVLDEHLIGPRKTVPAAATQITIADYFGAAMVGLGELIRCNYSAYPNVERWMRNMKALKSWPKVNEVFYGFAGSLKDTPFVAI